MRKTLLVLALSTSLFTFCSAQFNILHSFNDTLGANPWGNLTLAGNKLYGLATVGGLHSQGCIFSIDTDGSNYKDLLDFTGVNGAYPKGSLTISGKVMYGMTSTGGSHNYGRIFSVDTDGIAYANLLDFNGANGNAPRGSLTLAGNKLYGMTSAGGTQSSGNLFSIDISGGGYKDLLDFDTANGRSPFGSLLLSGKKLYGMTYQGGAHDSGCIFSIDTNGGSSYRDLFDFKSAKGYYPQGDVTLSGNKLFGMTWIGGANDWGVIFSIDTNGGGYKDLVDFNYNTNGGQPQGSLTLSGSGSVLYGMTFDGGQYTEGLLFSLDTNGNNFKDLYDLNSAKGNLPYGSFTLSGHELYGMTSAGGAYTEGVIFGCDTAGGLTGINNLIAATGSVNVYPNPSNGVFTVQMENGKWKMENEKATIEVYNLLGERKYSQFSILNSQLLLDLSSNPDGVYLYRITATDGELIGEGKLIIQK